MDRVWKSVVPRGERFIAVSQDEKRGGGRGRAEDSHRLFRCFIILARPAGFLSRDISREFALFEKISQGLTRLPGSFIITGEIYRGEAVKKIAGRLVAPHFDLPTLLISSFAVCLCRIENECLARDEGWENQLSHL